MKYWLVTILLSTCVIAQAQVRVEAGQPYQTVVADQKYYFSDAGEVMAVKIDNDRDIIIEKLSAEDMALKQSKSFDFPKDATFEEVLRFNGKYYLFYLKRDREIAHLFMREIMFASGVLSDNETELITTSRPIPNDYSRNPNFFFHFSSDSSTLLIQCKLTPKLKDNTKNREEVALHVFGPDMKRKWGKEVQMPYTETNMLGFGYNVDSGGSAYRLAGVSPDKTISVKRAGEYVYEVFKISAENQEIVMSPLNLSDRKIRTVKLYENNDGRMVAVGFYNDAAIKDGPDGIFTALLSAQGGVDKIGTHELSADIANQYTGSKKTIDATKGMENLSDMVITNALFPEDGSIVFVSEKRSSESSYLDGETTYKYFYDHILAAKISSDNTLQWIIKIPKRQEGNYVDALSFNCRFSQGKNYFIFLDTEKNASLSPENKPSLFNNKQTGVKKVSALQRDAVLTAFVVDHTTGAIKREVLVDTRTFQGGGVSYLTPRKIFHSNAAKVSFVEANTKSKEAILIKMTF